MSIRKSHLFEYILFGLILLVLLIVLIDSIATAVAFGKDVAGWELPSPYYSHLYCLKGERSCQDISPFLPISKWLKTKYGDISLLLRSPRLRRGSDRRLWSFSLDLARAKTWATALIFQMKKEYPRTKMVLIDPGFLPGKLRNRPVTKICFFRSKWSPREQIRFRWKHSLARRDYLIKLKLMVYSRPLGQARGSHLDPFLSYSVLPVTRLYFCSGKERILWP